MTDILMRPFVALQVAVHELREREDGQTTTEYAILLGFLAIAIIVALFFLRGVLRELFSDAARASRTHPAAHKAPDAGRLTPDGLGRKYAPARLPPRPGRRIRLSGGGRPTENHPFGIGDLAAQCSRLHARQLSPGGGRQNSCVSPTVPIGARRSRETTR